MLGDRLDPWNGMELELELPDKETIPVCVSIFQYNVFNEEAFLRWNTNEKIVTPYRTRLNTHRNIHRVFKLKF